MIANDLKNLIYSRTGLIPDEIECPREKSFMTPCVARDGDLAMIEDSLGIKICVGCHANVGELYFSELKNHAQQSS